MTNWFDQIRNRPKDFLKIIFFSSTLAVIVTSIYAVYRAYTKWAGLNIKSSSKTFTDFNDFYVVLAIAIFALITCCIGWTAAAAEDTLSMHIFTWCMFFCFTAMYGFTNAVTRAGLVVNETIPLGKNRIAYYMYCFALVHSAFLGPILTFSYLKSWRPPPKAPINISSPAKAKVRMTDEEMERAEQKEREELTKKKEKEKEAQEQMERELQKEEERLEKRERRERRHTEKRDVDKERHKEREREEDGSKRERHREREREHGSRREGHREREREHGSRREGHREREREHGSRRERHRERDGDREREERSRHERHRERDRDRNKDAAL